MPSMAPPRKRKPGAGRPKGPEPRKKTIAAFKGSEPFAEWFEGLVEHCRQRSGWSDLPASSVIERGLICLAEKEGYEPKPPKR
jgi:hypothetical protein